MMTLPRLSWIGLLLIALAVGPAAIQAQDLFDSNPSEDLGWGDEAPPLAEPMKGEEVDETELPTPTLIRPRPSPGANEPGGLLPPLRPPPESQQTEIQASQPEPAPPGPQPAPRRRGRRGRGSDSDRTTPKNLAKTAQLEGALGAEAPIEVEGPEIASIDILGNRLISTDVILLSLEAKVGDRIKESLVEKDVRNIQELGYFAYVQPEVNPTEDGRVSLLFKVIENPPLREVRVEGATLISAEELKENIVVEPGNILNSTQLKESFSRITKLYQDKGYIFCGILSTEQIDLDPENGILTLRIAEPVLGEIRISGNTKTKSFVALREFEVKRGRILKAESLRRSLRNLQRLNFFEEVSPPRPVLSDDLSVVDLEIEVSEQRTGQASAGGGYSSLNGVIGFIDVAERNFRGRGQTMRVKWEFGGQRSYQLDFVEPWFRGKPQSLGLSLFSTRVNRALFQRSIASSLYEERRTGFAISNSWRVAKDTRLSLSFSNENVRAQSRDAANPLPPGLIARDTDGDGIVDFDQQFVTLGWVKDARDNPFNANEGYRYAVSVSTTGGILKGPTGFNRYIFDARKYFPLGQRDSKSGKTKWTLANRTRYGFHSIFEGNLTFNDRFALGGTDSIRGYEDREFTGDRFFLSNVELRRHVSKVVSVVGFFDIGHAWGQDGISRDLKTSYGLGLRLTTPIGPFRLDYGKGETQSRFHFGIGQQF